MPAKQQRTKIREYNWEQLSLFELIDQVSEADKEGEHAKNLPEADNRVLQGDRQGAPRHNAQGEGSQPDSNVTNNSQGSQDAGDGIPRELDTPNGGPGNDFEASEHLPVQGRGSRTDRISVLDGGHDGRDDRRNGSAAPRGNHQHDDSDGLGELSETGSSGRQTRDGDGGLAPEGAPNPLAPVADLQLPLDRPLAPTSIPERAQANLAAIRVLTTKTPKELTVSDKDTLAAYSGWGGCAEVFSSTDPAFIQMRQELQNLLSPQEYAHAQTAMANERYTDPNIAKALINTLTQLGVPEASQILNPACGTGMFMGVPSNYSIMGVEVDHTAAQIAQWLYPMQIVIRADFAEIDKIHPRAVVGNVPVSNTIVVDNKFNKQNHPIHDYFVIKSLDLVETGGIVALITTADTMNTKNPSARIEMAMRGEMLGAVLLPDDIHMGTLGSNSQLACIILRKRQNRLDVEQARDLEWVKTTKIEKGIRLNQYFVANPKYILGRQEIVTEDTGSTLDLMHPGGRQLAKDFADALTNLSVRAAINEKRAIGATLSSGTDINAQGAGESSASGEPDGTLAVQPVAGSLDPTSSEVVLDDNIRIGTIHEDSQGRFFQRTALSRDVQIKVPATNVAELRQLIGIRDALLELLAQESQDSNAQEAHDLRTKLNENYDAYLKTYGPINRFRYSESIVDADLDDTDDDEAPEVRIRRIYPSLGGFRKDVSWRAVAALEVFDEETQVAAKAPIFTQAVIDDRAEQTGVDTVEEAITASMGEKGMVDVRHVALLLGISEEEASEAIEDLVFTDPQTGLLVEAQEYLSGNLGAKLDAVKEVYVQDPQKWERNYEALKAAMPQRIEMNQIHVRLGANWIDPDIIADAFNTVVAAPPSRQVEIAYNNISHRWVVSKRACGTVQYTDIYGMSGHPTYDAGRLLEQILSRGEITVEVPVPHGRQGQTMVEPTLTAEYRDKAEKLEEAIWQQIWSNAEVAERIVERYNEMFNSYVPRKYDGSTLRLPGLSKAFIPMPHQLDMVRRVVSSETALAAHDVGAGKTAEMIMSVMELKRLKLIKKPLIVVPNHVLEQFAREFNQLYPNAKVLVGSRNETKQDQRVEFAARAAMEEWDAVVMGLGTFGRIPLSAAVRKRYLREQVTSINQELQNLDRSSADKRTSKIMQKQLIKRKVALEDLIDSISGDGPVTLESLKWDYLVVDEAHLVKSLATYSEMPGMAIQGSQRATNVDMALQYLRETKEGQQRKRIAMFATATPITNSIAEMHVIWRYLNPKYLEAGNMTSLDEWLATFAKTRTYMELRSDGQGWRERTKIGSFCNVPEMMAAFETFADFKTAKDLGLKTPALKTGGIITQTIPRDESIDIYMSALGERADQVRNRQIPPEEDNFLKIGVDGTKCALDVSLVQRSYEDPEHSKIHVAAKRIVEIYQRTKDNVYKDEIGNDHPRPGALQLVFCDLSTPKPGDWNVYDALKRRLTTMGIPAGKIAFMQQAKSDMEKAKLFEAARSGSIAVLIGSTETMGTGVNVQRRAIAGHHLDIPYRPDQLTQRNGRIQRQGNQNPEIEIYLYVNEGSFDARKAEIVAKKSHFIEQIAANANGRYEGASVQEDSRIVEDIGGDEEMTYEYIKAQATGRPEYAQQAAVEAEVVKLKREAHTYEVNKHYAASGSTQIKKRIAAWQRNIDNANAISAQWEEMMEAVKLKGPDELEESMFDPVAAGETPPHASGKNDKSTNSPANSEISPVTDPVATLAEAHHDDSSTQWTITAYKRAYDVHAGQETFTGSAYECDEWITQNVTDSYDRMRMFSAERAEKRVWFSIETQYAFAEPERKLRVLAGPDPGLALDYEIKKIFGTSLFRQTRILARVGNTCRNASHIATVLTKSLETDMQRGKHFQEILDKGGYEHQEQLEAKEQELAKLKAITRQIDADIELRRSLRKQNGETVDPYAWDSKNGAMLGTKLNNALITKGTSRRASAPPAPQPAVSPWASLAGTSQATGVSP